MTEQQWDKKLKIHTADRDAARSDAYHYPYEPTPYCVLKRLADSGWITGDRVLVDYGCGRGRVGFFLSHRLGCRTIGVEYDEVIYSQALENRRSYAGTGMVDFVCCRAETYPVKDADCFYFFNPFSLEVLHSVFGRILASYFENPRTIRLFFYYPSDEYRTWLMTREFLNFFAELDCRDLFPGDERRETVLVFELA